MIHTLVNAGVTTCFANPGTSEMHFVAALDEVPGMRGVLALFEGVATGAADGYARMTDMPAATLLHLGPGLGNGVANLHNARRAGSPIVNIVGDHSTSHAEFDTPLQSDIDTLARNVSRWIERPIRVEDVAKATAQAVVAARRPPGEVATLILPADVSWSEGGQPVEALTPEDRSLVGEDRLGEVVRALRSGEPCAILLGGHAVRRPQLDAAARIAAGTSARVLTATFVARTERGAGIPGFEKLQYFSEGAVAQLAGMKHVILVDCAPPTSFFAYPERPSILSPEGCTLHVLASATEDSKDVLMRLADVVGVKPPPSTTTATPDRPSGMLTAASVGATIAAMLPEGAIVSDESATAAAAIRAATAACPPHDWIQLTGGAIGQGIPVATGAAIACPDRPVISIEGDGGAMYTIQALWTQARESLDVTTIIINNRSYAILQAELLRTGAGVAGPRANALLDLSQPDIDFVHIAEGFGVPAVGVHSVEELMTEIARALREPGPHLIDAVMSR